MRHVVIAVLLMAATARADAPPPAAPEAKPAFSHKTHIEDLDAACKDCHDTAAATPRVDQKKCLECHEDGTPPYSFQGIRRRLMVAFPHKRHTAVDCAKCHEATVQDLVPAGGVVMERRMCSRCHQARKVSVPETGCAKCHGTNQRKVKPLDHGGSWLRRHGEASTWRDPNEHGKGCAQCHGKATCVSCHDQMAPRDHNGLFRVRMHGSAASWDRDRCQTCHTASMCINCHTTTPPPNHAGAWTTIHGLVAASRDDERCMTCHRPATCTNCHSRRSP